MGAPLGPAGRCGALLLGGALLGGLVGCPHPAPPPSVDVGASAPLPPMARAILDAGAADLDVSTRRAALGLLVTTSPDPGGGEWGKRGRYDPSPYVQRTVVAALGERHDAASLALLGELAADPAVEPYTRGEAAAARLAADPSALGDVAALAAAEPRTDRAAALLLAAAADPTSRARLVGFLADGDLPLEPGFVRRLGACPFPEVPAALAAALPRVEPELRLLIAGALLSSRPDDGLPPLRAAVHGADPDARMEALDVIEGADTPAAVTLLREARLVPDPLVRGRATLALVGAGLQSPASLPSALEDDERELRLAALRAARDLRRRDPAALPARAAVRIRDLALAPDPAEQIAAIRALDAHDDVDRAVAEGLFGDESLQVRVEAVAALAGR